MAWPECHWVISFQWGNSCGFKLLTRPDTELRYPIIACANPLLGASSSTLYNFARFLDLRSSARCSRAGRLLQGDMVRSPGLSKYQRPHCR